jgi:hypothetical protein
MTNSLQHSSLPFFFIIGRPRSGTTLLRTILDAHPNVAIPLESPMIKELGSKYSRVKVWDVNLLLNFFNDLIIQRRFDIWDCDLITLKSEILSCVGEYSFSDLIKIVYLNYPSYFEKAEIEIIGDKNPPFSTYPQKIFRLFPEAKYIHLTRDYRDNILSVMKVEFEAPYVPLISYRWRYAAVRIEKLKRKYPEQFYTLKYEDLVADPEKEMKALCSFLNIDYYNSMLEFYKIKDKLLQKYTIEEIEKVHKSLFNPITNVKVDGWKSKMKRKHIKQADLIAGKYAELNGYNREYTTFSLSIYFSVIPGIIYGWISQIGRLGIDLFPMRMRIGIQEKGSILASTYWLFYKVFKKKN